MKAKEITIGNQYTLAARLGGKYTVTVVSVSDRKQPLGARRTSDYIATLCDPIAMPDDPYFIVLDEDATVAVIGFDSCATGMGRQVHFVNPRRLSELVSTKS
jgi:hypothetical protein